MATKTASAPLPAVRATNFLANRRWLAQIVAGVVLVGLVAAIALNHYLSEAYGPEGTATSYLNAIAAGDASTAWSLITLASPASRTQVDLATQTGIRAELSDPATRGIDAGTMKVVSSRASYLGYEVIASYRSAGKPTQQTITLVQDPSSKHFLFYPAWHVYLRPATVQLSLPPSTGAVSLDGLAIPAGTKTLSVLPGLHTLAMGAGGFYEATRTAASVQPSDPFASTTIALKPKLAAAAQTAAGSAIKAAFAFCAKADYSNAFYAMSCPNSFENPQALRDPTQDLVLYVGDDGALYAQGHSAFLEHWAGSIDLVGGAFLAKLTGGGSQLKVVAFAPASTTTSVPPLARPANVSDDAVRSAVSAGFQACAATTSVSKPGCPQTLYAGSFPPQHIHWDLNADPLVGATVTWDSGYGLFMVKGKVDMVGQYDVTILDRTLHQTSPTRGSYRALLTADGSGARLVSIDMA